MSRCKNFLPASSIIFTTDPIPTFIYQLSDQLPFLIARSMPKPGSGIAHEQEAEEFDSLKAGDRALTTMLH